MVDVREDILARLLEVVATIPNIRSVYRNNVNVDETELPSAVVLDGDEETNDAQNRPSKMPMIAQMTPDIIIIHQDPNVGSELDVFRRELIKRVLADTELNNLVAKSSPRGDGAIRYLGCQVGNCGWLRTLHGGFKANFMFKYALRPEQL